MFLFFAFPKEASATNYYWVGGTTNSIISNPDNWDTAAGICADSGDAAVPGASDSAFWSSSCVKDATVDSNLSVNTFQLLPDYSGTVTVDGVAVNVLGANLLANGGNLNIANGGSVTVASGYQIMIGYLAGDNGTITVDGPGSQLINSNARIRVGNLGIGTLIIQNGGYASTAKVYAGYGVDSEGYITVDGTGSIWDANAGGSLGFIGRQGTASLTISNGAVVNSLATPWQIGGISTGIGTVTITGTGSELNMTSDISNLRVGYSGTGTLNVEDGGAVSSGDKVTVADQVGSTGTINIGAGYTMDQITAPGGVLTGSGTYSLPPDPPTSLSSTASLYSIDWDWEDVATATGYKVYNSSSDSLLTTISLTSKWTQNSLLPSTSYGIYVRSSNAQGVGYASLDITATTDEVQELDIISNPIIYISTDNSETETIEPEIVEEGYRLEVKVVDDENNPVEGAKVTLLSNGQEVITDENGIAVFEKVEKGEHTVSVAYESYEGEQKINLSGEVDEYYLTVHIKGTSPSLNNETESSPLNIKRLSLLVIGIIIIILIWIVYKRKKQQRQ
ncbi:MAG TPA: hypothetical protein ENI23_11920 [bacterium]|nr:hypothetical protein [bacterium]